MLFLSSCSDWKIRNINFSTRNQKHKHKQGWFCRCCWENVVFAVHCPLILSSSILEGFSYWFFSEFSRRVKIFPKRSSVFFSQRGIKDATVIYSLITGFFYGEAIFFVVVEICYFFCIIFRLPIGIPTPKNEFFTRTTKTTSTPEIMDKESKIFISSESAKLFKKRFPKRGHLFEDFWVALKAKEDRLLDTKVWCTLESIFMTSNHDEYVGYLEYLEAGLVPRVTDSDVTFILQQEQEPEELEESEHEDIVTEHWRWHPWWHLSKVIWWTQNTIWKTDFILDWRTGWQIFYFMETKKYFLLWFQMSNLFLSFSENFSRWLHRAEESKVQLKSWSLLYATSFSSRLPFFPSPG